MVQPLNAQPTEYQRSTASPRHGWKYGIRKPPAETTRDPETNRWLLAREWEWERPRSLRMLQLRRQRRSLRRSLASGEVVELLCCRPRDDSSNTTQAPSGR